MIVSHFPGGNGSGSKPIWEFIEYSGSVQYIDDGDGNWRAKFLTSGEFTPKEDIHVDIFAVGAGGAGSSYTYTSSGFQGGAGGGGGYTKTVRGLHLQAGITYTVTIGAPNGGASSFVEKDGETMCEAAGGKNASSQHGGDGGSGGSASGYGGFTALPGSDGGSGNDVVNSNGLQCRGGVGQGTTTREFGEETGDLYAGGGGSYVKDGGEGGGGKGGSASRPPANGDENTGGGGGGTSSNTGYTATPGNGGSGVVIIRNMRIVAA